MKTIRLILIAFALSTLSAGVSSAEVNVHRSTIRVYRLASSDISAYLATKGHTTLTEPVTVDGYTWTCTTKKTDGLTYFVTVYTDGDNIIGFDEEVVG